MAWNAQVEKTDRQGDKLNISVAYTSDSGETFGQTIVVDGIQQDTYLTDQINFKLNQLNNLDTYQQTIEGDKSLASPMTAKADPIQ